MTTYDDRPPPVDEPPHDPYEPAHYGHTPTPEPEGRTSRAPHDPLAERYVLGAALASPAALTDCMTIITAADFYLPTHEALWRTLTHLAATDQPTAPPAVVAHLVDTRQTSGPQGIDPTMVFELFQGCDTPAQAPYYAHRVDRLARRRRGLTAVRQAVQRLEAPGDDADIDNTLAETAQALNDAHHILGHIPTPTSWSPVDLGPVLAGEHLDPPPTMLARNDGVFLLYDGAVHTISGESESGKTWLLLLSALQLIQDQQRVVFLDFEDRADRVIGRLLSLGATLDEIRGHFAYIRPDRPLDDDGRAQLAPALADTRLVILDGVTEAMTTHGFDLNSNADSAIFQAMLPRWVADHGPAVAMIDHVVKDKEKQDRFALGAQHKLAGIDGAAYIVKMLQPFGRGKRGLARVEVAKDRPGHVREHAHGKTIAEFALDATRNELVLTAELSPPGAQSGRAGDTFEPTIFMERLSRTVQLTPGLSKKALEDLIPGKAATKRLALEILVTRGYIRVEIGTRGAVQHYHVRPYYADPEKDPDNQPDEHPDTTTDTHPDTTQETP